MPRTGQRQTSVNSKNVPEHDSHSSTLFPCSTRQFAGSPLPVHRRHRVQPGNVTECSSILSIVSHSIGTFHKSGWTAYAVDVERENLAEHDNTHPLALRQHVEPILPVFRTYEYKMYHLLCFSLTAVITGGTVAPQSSR